MGHDVANAAFSREFGDERPESRSGQLAARIPEDPRGGGIMRFNNPFIVEGDDAIDDCLKDRDRALLRPLSPSFRAFPLVDLLFKLFIGPLQFDGALRDLLFNLLARRLEFGLPKRGFLALTVHLGAGDEKDKILEQNPTEMLHPAPRDVM